MQMHLEKNSFSTPISKAVYQSSFITSGFVITSTFVTATLYSTFAKCIIGSLNGIEANNKNYLASGIKLFIYKHDNTKCLVIMRLYKNGVIICSHKFMMKIKIPL